MSACQHFVAPTCIGCVACGEPRSEHLSEPALPYSEPGSVERTVRELGGRIEAIEALSEAHRSAIAGLGGHLGALQRTVDGQSASRRTTHQVISVMTTQTLWDEIMASTHDGWLEVPAPLMRRLLAQLRRDSTREASEPKASER